MFSLLIAGLAPGFSLTTMILQHQHEEISVRPSSAAKPFLISGLGQGFCWAKTPYPNGPVTKLTNYCGGGGEGKKISAAVLLPIDPTNSISTTTQPTPVGEARMKTSLPEPNGTWEQEHGPAFLQAIAVIIGFSITVMELAFNPIA